MSGMAFMAIRLRTDSLYPGMLLHAVFDFSLMALSFVASADRTAGPGGISVLPPLFVVPNLLYGLWLMRHAARDEADQGLPVVATGVGRDSPRASTWSGLAGLWYLCFMSATDLQLRELTVGQ
ncbi:hypothetical protein GCM10011529_15440 [Polymorphobacter glacialis]|uniref:CPBP family intramembrane metalloprotease n=1 Tax=Sandarakinorhabdus glacialis TaxID=1614636 RepID=A0A917E6Q4_9SPHN|nr:hypothetical protein [Polymorphobacter glacialis]GGE10009.1 hypothetical protein GCM10011529_15440 [Polymorphobacter glacialis]